MGVLAKDFLMQMNDFTRIPGIEKEADQAAEQITRDMAPGNPTDKDSTETDSPEDTDPKEESKTKKKGK
jgi:hypothetical protein